MLKTERIMLRAVEPEDLDLIYLVENDTRLWAFGSTNVPLSRHAVRSFLATTQNDLYKDGQLRLCIEGVDGIVKGFLDLQNFAPAHLRAEVGIVLLPEWQRQGLASEALGLLCDYARSLRLHQLYAVVDAANAPAVSLFTRQKFEPSGRLAEWLKNDSGFSDALVLQKKL